MNVKMFMYLNKQSICKAIANHFNVKKLSSFKVLSISHDQVPSDMCICAYYNVDKNIIYVDELVWSVSTEYERWDTVVHEIVHAYQHKYDLCIFDYKKTYEERPQELHCVYHTSMILETLGIYEEDSVLDLFKEEA